MFLVELRLVEPLKVSDATEDSACKGIQFSTNEVTQAMA
jgi:hypothetical protein